MKSEHERKRINTNTNIYKKKRYNSDPLFKEFISHKRSIHSAIKNYHTNGTQWKMRNVECDVETLLNHLQATAEDNGYHGFDIHTYDHHEYHIDHIQPAKYYYDGTITIYELCHWSNLQILSSDSNNQKGGS